MHAGKPKSVNERAQRGSGGGNSGPDSWQFWGPNRQLLQDGNEKGQWTGAGLGGGHSGPGGMHNQQKEAGQKKNGGNSGPDSWQFWGPNRQLLNQGEHTGSILSIAFNTTNRDKTALLGVDGAQASGTALQF